MKDEFYIQKNRVRIILANDGDYDYCSINDVESLVSALNMREIEIERHANTIEDLKISLHQARRKIS